MGGSGWQTHVNRNVEELCTNQISQLVEAAARGAFVTLQTDESQSDHLTVLKDGRSSLFAKRKSTWKLETWKENVLKFCAMERWWNFFFVGLG